jgi:hypothetical protein
MPGVFSVLCDSSSPRDQPHWQMIYNRRISLEALIVEVRGGPTATPIEENAPTGQVLERRLETLTL